MEYLHIALSLLTIVFIGLLFTSVRLYTLKKKNRLLSQQLTETTLCLEMAREALTKLQETREFHNNLGDTELTTKLQKPRLNAALNTPQHRNTPEKYSYIHTLAEQGMAVEEIATILKISTHEAKQLVTLAKIAQGN